MHPVITIDQGNTRTKTHLMLEGRVLADYSGPTPSLEIVLAMQERWGQTGAIYRSVGCMDVRFIESLRHLTEKPVRVLTHATPLPVRIDYATPQTLGTDRIVAAVGALKLLGEGVPALVVDAGTCITLDILDASATFRGGNISPGIRMRLDAMHRFTDRLPEVTTAGDTPLFGYDTVTALRAGAIRGIAGEVKATLLAARARYGVQTLVLSGGDMQTLIPFISEDLNDYNDLRIFPAADLIPVGLEEIYRYNENL